ncbi:MAG: C39 family peptidase [Myxococcaceae bacterium]|nr:C39 family peptidase [Myxococcaceae bacterium]
MRIERTVGLLASSPSNSRPAEAARPAVTATRPRSSAALTRDTFESPRSTPSIHKLSIDGPNTDPATGGRADFDQGKTNACGTTSLAIALHRMGIEVPREEIDREIRNYDIFTPVTAIVDYARQHGLQANSYNEGSFAQLQRDLADGRQILVITDVGGYDQRRDLEPGSKNDLSNHWLVVTDAYEKNGEQYVSYMNPWGTRETLPYSKFEKLWSDVHLLGFHVGYDRAYVLIDRANAAPLRPSTDAEIVPFNTAAGGVSNVVNGWAQVTRGEVWDGVVRMGRGARDTVIGGVSTLVTQGGRTVVEFFRGLFD